jgi:peptidoglycan/xylan/chitin deacetylase (PgdA/CDA1 family)
VDGTILRGGNALPIRTWLFLLLTAPLFPQAPVYVVLWFDTEDYIEPAADDAALRLAQDLDQLGVRATFKVVGEKARTLELRNRRDVIRALSRHDIGYHTNYHSIPPAPAVYLRTLGLLEGAAEFERREASGVADLRRLFGVTASCYGQPGSSWGPQSNLALRRLGIPVYLDEGSQAGVNEQPFWYGGLLYVFKMGQFLVRPNLNDESRLEETLRRFDQASQALAPRGGGVISTYYHPTEFVTTEFWDAVNFSRGANPERADWKRPRLRTPEDSERAYRILRRYVEHAKSRGARFVTARDLLQLYDSTPSPPLDGRRVALHLAERQTFLVQGRWTYSAADLLLTLLNIEPQYVDGPTSRAESTFRSSTISRPDLDRATADAVSYIRRHRRLPAQVWIGSETLSLADFTATLAAADGSVHRGNLECERYISTDPAGSFNWPIHPENFRAPELLELGRLQAWTLKPASLR